MNHSIKSWAEDDRPREKLVLKGKHVLSDAEVLAIIIGTGTRKYSAVDLAKHMLSENENKLGKLAKLSLTELTRYPGIGQAKAISIIAALELGKRKDQNEEAKKQIRSSRDGFEVVRYYLEGLDHEEFYVIYLNRANRVQAVEQISKGGLSGTVADGKVIFRKALHYGSSAIILSHNHPSGALHPSDSDKTLTKSLVSFGKLVDIQVLDHLIVSGNNYFSFADEGIIS